MRLTIGNSDGEQTVEYPKPGATIRFAVGTPQAHGLPWRVWAGRTSRDVYLMVRASHTVSKWSFHATGDWRLQHLSEHVEATGAERIVDAWMRPSADEHGLVRAISIHTPTDDLVLNETFPVTGKDVLWIPPAPPGEVTAVYVVILEVPEQRVEFAPGMQIIGTIPLVDDTVVLLISQTHALFKHAVDNHNHAREIALAHMSAEDIADPGSRITPYGHDDEGFRFVWDLRLIENPRL